MYNQKEVKITFMRKERSPEEKERLFEYVKKAIKELEKEEITAGNPKPETSKPAKRNLLPFPSSPVSSLLQETLIAGKPEDIAEMPDRRKQISHSEKNKIEIVEYEASKSIRITRETENSITTLQIANIERLARNNEAAYRFLMFDLAKATEIIYGGNPSRDYITYSLQELVDGDMYANKDAARKAFKNAHSIILGMQIQGSIEIRGKRPHSIDRLSVIFYDATCADGQCAVYLNTHIDWGMIMPFFEVIPDYWTALNIKSMELLFFLCGRARHKAKNIAEKGYFDTRLRLIQERMHLPSEIGNRRPTQTIIAPIEKAMEGIEDVQKTHDRKDIQFELLYDENSKMKDRLDNGTLRTYINGDMKKRILNATKTNKKDEKRKIKN